jgi:hypothetical protein
MQLFLKLNGVVSLQSVWKIIENTVSFYAFTVLHLRFFFWNIVLCYRVNGALSHSDVVPHNQKSKDLR